MGSFASLSLVVGRELVSHLFLLFFFFLFLYFFYEFLCMYNIQKNLSDSTRVCNHCIKEKDVPYQTVFLFFAVIFQRCRRSQAESASNR